MKKIGVKLFAFATVAVLSLSNGFAQEADEEIFVDDEAATSVPVETEEEAPVPAAEDESFEYSEEEF